MEGYYKVKVRCLNCGERTEVEIPKGVFISSWLNSKGKGLGFICPNCGCPIKELREREKE